MTESVVTSLPIAVLVSARLREAHKIIEREYALPLTAQRLSRRVRLPRFAFQRVYEQAYGISPLDHLRQCRTQAAARLLAKGCDAHAVALLVGYNQQNIFESEYRRAFRKDPPRLKLLERVRTVEG